MAGILNVPGLWPVFDANGDPVSGATINFYEPSTTTPKAVYSDTTLATALGTSLTTNAAGEPTTLAGAVARLWWAASGASFDVQVIAGASTRTWSNVGVESGGGGGDGIPYLDTAYGGSGDGTTNNVTALGNAVTSNPDQIRVKSGTYLLNSNVSLGSRILEMTQGAAFSGSGAATPGAQNFTNSERYGIKYANTSLKAYDIYGAIFPSVSYYDVFQSIARLAPSSALASHIAAIAGYIQVDAPASGIGNNGVALFGGGRVSVDNGIAWGFNSLLQDNNLRATHSGTGRYLLGAELDFNVMSAATQVVGVSVGGNSLVQPTTSSAYIVNTLGESINARWGVGLFAMDNCISDTGAAVSIGAKRATGANIDSQSLWFSWRDSTDTKQLTIVRMVSDYFEVASSGPVKGFVFQGPVFDTFGNVRNLPGNQRTSAYTLTAADAGRRIVITTGGITVPLDQFSEGQRVVLINKSGSSQTITMAGGVTCYLAGTASTGNRTLPQRGVCELICDAANTFYISGTVT